MDDYSRATWTYLLYHKSQTFTTFKHFLSMIFTQFQKRIKVIRLDNGGEFTSRDFHAYFLQHGIIHMCIYTIAKLVERKHKHLMQLARALIFQTSMPTCFWDYTLLMASYLVNLLPKVALRWKTPYEILNGVSSTYNALRVFGSLCYATNTLPSKDKFSPRTYPCVFLGYPPSTKGYTPLDLISHTIFHSHDVSF